LTGLSNFKSRNVAAKVFDRLRRKGNGFAEFIYPCAANRRAILISLAWEF
jgi:hypothetical protein